MHSHHESDAALWRKKVSPAAAHRTAALLVRVLALAGVVLLSLVLCRPAAAQKTYELPQCKTDAKGKVYIALGRTVLGLPPPNANGTVSSTSPKGAMLPAPDPAEPEGCPDNPAQVQSLSLVAFLPLTRDPPGQSMQNVWATQSGLRLSSDGVFPKPPTNYPDMEASWPFAVLVESQCASTNPDRSEIDGVETCLVRPKGALPPDLKSPEHWGRSYRVSPTRYGTPRGRPFMIACDLRAGQPHWPDFCNVGYVLATGEFLEYRFFPPESGYPASFVDDVIAFDREARALLADGLWPDYPWPIPSPPAK